MLQHAVVTGVSGIHFKKFLDARDSRNAHRLGDFHGIGTPGRDHFFARADETAGEFFFRQRFGPAKEPDQFFQVSNRKGLRVSNGIQQVGLSTKEDDHGR